MTGFEQVENPGWLPSNGSITSAVSFNSVASSSSQTGDMTPYVDSGGFEGPEKTLEIVFDATRGPTAGVLTLSRSDWDEILQHARCSILNVLETDEFTSYVLSESSLFVYKHKILIKTCGTTTLLCALPPILKHATHLNMEMTWLGYSRKDYTYPEAQQYPHRSVDEEMDYLKKHFPMGCGYVVGPITGDHCVVFVADCEKSTKSLYVKQDTTLNMMMYGLDVEAASIFEQSDDIRNAYDARVRSGISEILPGSEIQDWLFEPCGYSMNGMLGEAYWTIHITPESHCSYASFETNAQIDDVGKLIKQVLGIFRPARFTMTLCADENKLAKLTIPFYQSMDAKNFNNDGKTAFKASARCTTHMGSLCCIVGNYVQAIDQVDSVTKQGNVVLLPQCEARPSITSRPRLISI